MPSTMMVEAEPRQRFVKGVLGIADADPLRQDYGPEDFQILRTHRRRFKDSYSLPICRAHPVAKIRITKEGDHG